MGSNLDDFAKHLKTERNCSPHTISNYTRDLKFLINFLKGKKHDRSTAREYLLALEKKRYSRRSIARKLSSARSFFRFLVREKCAKQNPFENLLTPKLPRKLPNFLYPEELKSLLDAQDLSSPLGLRDRAILEVIYGTGLRVAEIIRMNINDVETGSSLQEDNSVKFYDFGSPANTIDGWYCTWSPVKCVTAEGNFAVEMNMEPLADIAAQYLPNIESIPLLWSGRPDANLLGGGHYGPLEAHFVAQAGYPFLLGEKIAEEFDLGKHTPHLMFPINYDLRSGELVPGQNWDESLAVPGTSEAHGYLTTSGRYVVQKAELFARMYYYLLQGNVLPDLPSSIVPARWQVGQPIGGFAIYEPESFRDGAWNQADLNVFFVEWALENLCEQPECDLEEAAARLGYASWNLDKVFDKHLDEALTRGEISSAEHDDLHEQGDKAAADCRAARELLLRDQPEDPTTEEISQARSYCESALHGLSIICEVLHTQNSND